MRCVRLTDYPNYSIYEDGRLYSHKTKRFIKQFLNRGGYMILNLSRPGEKPISHRVHRIVAENFLGQAPEDKSDVNHIDGNKSNNHVSNLEWSNKSHNGLHAHKMGLNHGQSLPGEKHPMSKLTETDVIKIRELSKTMSNKELGKLYNINPSYMWRIVTRRNWKHI